MNTTTTLPLTPAARLHRIAELTSACPPPDVVNGYDLCAHGDRWPCAHTVVAWLARGLDPAVQTAQQADRDAAVIRAAAESSIALATFRALAEQVAARHDHGVPAGSIALLLSFVHDDDMTPFEAAALLRMDLEQAHRLLITAAALTRTGELAPPALPERQ